MHEGILPAVTELILGLCFGIINVGLYIFWNPHNCKEHLDTCVSSGILRTVNCLNSWNLRSFILFRDYGAERDYSCKVLMLLIGETGIS